MGSCVPVDLKQEYNHVLCVPVFSTPLSFLKNLVMGRLAGSAVEHLPSARDVVLEARDRVPCRARGMEPASPSACVSASLSFSV